MSRPLLDFFALFFLRRNSTLQKYNGFFSNLVVVCFFSTNSNTTQCDRLPEHQNDHSEQSQMSPKIIVLNKSNVAKRKMEDELSVETQPPTNTQRVNDVARIGEPQRGVPQAIMMPAERHGYHHLIQPLSIFQERHEVTSDPALATIPALKVRISDLVNDLNKSKTIEEAVYALSALTLFFSNKIEEHMNQAAAAKLIQSNHGVGAILMALKKWKPSSFLLQINSLKLLSCITYYPRYGKCAN